MDRKECLQILAVLTLLCSAQTIDGDESNETLSNEISGDEKRLPEVEIDSGKLIGTFYKTAGGRKAYAFLGVPFAAPPVNELRFKEPRPHTPWNGTRPAVDMNYNSCLQMNQYRLVRNISGIYGDEDCLYLNVYTPRLFPTKELMDVIVYIHGGAFMFADGKAYSPKFLLDKTDLVFVSINYRLGPFGFITTDDELIPGNNGLKDQVFALKWVQNNILKFGGDRNRVTIAGMSAGGASVHYHFLSKLSQNLFSKGISLSGVATNPWALMENGKNKTIILANSLNCDTTNSTTLLLCLQHVPGEKILENMQTLFMPWLYNPFSPFGPSVEPFQDSKAFLSEHPHDLLKKGDVKNAPWLISATADEGLYPGAQFITNNNTLNELNNNWYIIAPHLLDYNFTTRFGEHNVTSKTVYEHYFQNYTINLKSRQKLVNLLSDRLFLNDIGKAGKLYAAQSNNTYLYKFSFRGKHSLSEYLTHTFEHVGISHGDDLPYILGCYFHDLDKRGGEKELMEVMVNMWVNFIKTGKPNSGIRNVIWNPVESFNASSYVEYLEIGSHQNFTIRRDNNFGDWKFWDTIGLEE